MDPIIFRQLQILLYVASRPGVLRREIQREFNLSTSQTRRLLLDFEAANLLESRVNSNQPTAPKELHPAPGLARITLEIALEALSEIAQLNGALQDFASQTEERLARLEDQIKQRLRG